MAKTRHVIYGILLAAIIITSIQAATAFSSYKTAFNTKYGTSGTRLDTCGLCHDDPSGGGSRNLFGQAFEAQSGHSSNPSQAFSNIEPLDSDNDGYSNFAEILARTFPGDQNDHPAPAPVLTTITVSPATASLTVGGAQTFTAAAKDQNGNPFSTTVTWSSSDTTVGTINSAGVFTALAAGTTTISATSGSVSGTASVTVSAPAPTPVLTTITVSPSTATLVVGNTRQFTAATKDQNGNPISAAVTWSSSNTTVGTIDSTGKFTAHAAGVAAVEAASGTVSGTAAVTVMSLTLPPPPPTPSPTPVLTTITVSPSTASLLIGGNRTFTAATKDQNGDPISAVVTWSSSNATVGTIDSAGKFTALAAGHTTIMARSGSVNETASATVTAPVTSLPPSSEQTFRVTFVIVDAETGKPVHEAKVTLDGVTKETNHRGQVTFRHVTAGNHTYTVTGEEEDDDDDGYQQSSGTINVTGNTVVQVKLTPIEEHEDRLAPVREHDDDEDEDDEGS